MDDLTSKYADWKEYFDASYNMECDTGCNFRYYTAGFDTVPETPGLIDFLYSCSFFTSYNLKFHLLHINLYKFYYVFVISLSSYASTSR